MTYSVHDCDQLALRTGVTCWDCRAHITCCTDCGADLTRHHRDCEA